MSTKTSFYIVSLLVFAIFLLGLLVGFGRPDLTDAERERARIENEALERKLAIDIQHKATMRRWLEIGKVAGGALILMSIAGTVFVALRWADRRSSEIQPDQAGLYPVVRIRSGGMKMLADPNRMARPVVMYGPTRLADRVAVHAIPSGEPVEQMTTTARAQAVQLMAAANRHPRVYTGALPAAPPVDALPAGDPAEPAPWPWPARVPLTGLLNGRGTSLHGLILGVSVNQENGTNEIVTGDMSRLVHVAVGGSSGWGKSVFLRSLAYQLAICPERPDLVLVDLEGVTFEPFGNCDSLLYPIADTEADALAVFKMLTSELDRRKALFAEYAGVDSLPRYNAKSADSLSPIVCLTDEATALLADRSVACALRTLALRGRKYGLWLTLGGQDWKASSLDTAIRNQLSARVQFRAMSAAQSRVLLQRSGAENLDTPGRALAVLPGRGLVEFQAPMISLDDILNAMDGDGPRHSLPTSDDVGQDELIRKLAAEGLSKRAIQERVFGYAGGAAYSAVSQVLDGE